MLNRNDRLLLLLDGVKAFYNQTDYIPVEKIALELASRTEIDKFNDNFKWIEIEIRHVAERVIKAEIKGFYKSGLKNDSFPRQKIDSSSFDKLILFSGNTGSILSLAQRKSDRTIGGDERAPDLSDKNFTTEKGRLIRENPLGWESFETSQHEENPGEDSKNTELDREAVSRSTEHAVSGAGPISSETGPDQVENVERAVNFTCSFDEVTFTDGYAECIKKMWWGTAGRFFEITFKIRNDFLRHEFNSLKKYFSNALKIRDIQIKALLKMSRRACEIITQHSDEIDSINSSLLNDIRYMYIKEDLLSNIQGSNIATIDQLFSERDPENIKPGTFGISDTTFVDDIITITKPKHHRQVEYLSSMHRSDLCRLRIVRRPLSFLFLLSGSGRKFFVWETFFGTDATYIWKFAEETGDTVEMKNQLSSVESALTMITESGREEYLRIKPANFIRILHDYIHPDGFETWKKNLCKVLKGKDREITEAVK